MCYFKTNFMDKQDISIKAVYAYDTHLVDSIIIMIVMSVLILWNLIISIMIMMIVIIVLIPICK